jgi:soluble lytic murein transglycosylase-like protein
MTVVLILSTAVVTGAALHGGSPSAVVSVCPGAKAAPASSASSGVTTAPTVRAGALPAPLVAQPVRLQLLPVFRQWASICAVPVALVEATCWWESGWQQDVVSVTGAVGVCQIEPAAAQTVRGLLEDDTLDPRSSSDNIEISSAYLRWLLDETGGRQDLALAGYYQGLTSVREHGILPVSRPYVTGITALLDDYSWS